MPRQGKIVTSGLLSEWTRIVLFLAVAFFVSGAWGACTSGTYSVNTGYAGTACYVGTTCAQYGYFECSSLCESRCTGTYQSGGVYYSGLSGATINGNYGNSCTVNPDGCANGGGMYTNVYCTYSQRCDTQAEADSAYCALNPGAEGCVEEDVPPSCMSDYQKCISMNGVWKKVGSTATECASECDLCGSAGQTAVKNFWVTVCCAKNKAPPGDTRACYTPSNLSGSGMVESVFADEYNSWDCGSLTTSDGSPIQENQELYKRFCLDGERYEEQVDTNDVGGSSGGGSGASSSSETPASFGTELDALGGVYGVLDTIRDTLVKRLTPASENIYSCLLMGTACTGPLQIDWTDMPRDTSSVSVDSSILKYIVPLLDSSVRIDSAHLVALRGLDTNILKQLHLDSAILRNDSTTRRVISGLIGEGTDTTRKWMRRLSDTLGLIRGLLDSAINGGGAETPSDTGWGEYGPIGMDTLGNGLLSESDSIVGYWASDTSVDGYFPAIESADTSWSDSIPHYSRDTLEKVLQDQVDSARDSLGNSLKDAFDTLRKDFPLINFDSLIIDPLGMSVPNTNTCPDHCFTFSIDDGTGDNSWLSSIKTVNFKLCDNLPGMPFNVFILLRLIARILVAVGCVMIGMWFIAGRRD